MTSKESWHAACAANWFFGISLTLYWFLLLLISGFLRFLIEVGFFSSRYDRVVNLLIHVLTSSSLVGHIIWWSSLLSEHDVLLISQNVQLRMIMQLLSQLVFKGVYVSVCQWPALFFYFKLVDKHVCFNECFKNHL